MAGATGRAGLADDRQRDVLGRHAGGKLTLDLDQHVLGLFLDQRLRREDMFDLGCSDTVGQGAEGTVRGGMAVAANDGHARLGPALLGSNDVDDTLTRIVYIIDFNPEVLGVLAERFHLNARLLVLDALQTGRIGRDVVVRHGYSLFRCAGLAAGHAKSFEGLRAGDLVDEMAIDVEAAGAVLGFMGDVGVPDFVVERTGVGHMRDP